MPLTSRGCSGLLLKTCVYDTSSEGAVFDSVFLLMGKDILYNNMNFPDRAAARQCASARTLHVATMEAVTRLERLGLARTLRVVVVARLA